jgi:hypothetical protein
VTKSEVHPDPLWTGTGTGTGGHDNLAGCAPHEAAAASELVLGVFCWMDPHPLTGGRSGCGQGVGRPAGREPA